MTPESPPRRMQLVLEPDGWKVVLLNDETIHLRAHAYGVEGGEFIFSVLMEGSPHFEVHIARIPKRTVRYAMSDDSGLGATMSPESPPPTMELVDEPIGWKVVLLNDETIQLLAHSYSVESGELIFWLLMKGSPHFLVDIARIPKRTVRFVMSE